MRNAHFFSIIFLILLISFIGCKKNNTDVPATVSMDTIVTNNRLGLLYKVYDSLNPAVRDTFEYNLGKMLVKFISHGQGRYVDTFIYNANNLVISRYNSGTTISNPYLQSEYVYQNNVLVSSSYYNSNFLVFISNTTYIFDNLGRLSQLTQTRVPSSVSLMPTYTSRFEYDANSNLSRVYYREAPYTEYLQAEYLNYDNKVNPYYKLPWQFDYNIYQASVDKFSKNNVGKINIYGSYQGSISSLSTTTTYTYDYNPAGKISKRRGGAYGTKYFLYN